MARQATVDIPNITIHPASIYGFSCGFFPKYFIFDEKNREKAQIGIEAQLFRKYIAPALGINKFYIGAVSSADEKRRTSTELASWFKTETMESPLLDLVQVPCFQAREEPVSSSTVRMLITTRGLEAARGMIPESTYLYIRDHLHSNLSPCVSPREKGKGNHANSIRQKA